jgi:SAM-dependent methyltransferase
MTDADWASYLRSFHAQRAGITERVLRRLDDSPYGWLADPLTDTTGWIVDLACGSAPTRDYLAEHPWVGVDVSRNELGLAVATGRGPLVRARADALPIADGVAAAVCVAMALQVVTPLADVLGEVKRVLRPAGLLVALVPSRRTRSLAGWLRWVRVLRALRVTGLPWPNPDACDDLPSVLARQGFKTISSERRTFWYPLDTPEAAALLIDSLYLPHVRPRRIAVARHRLGSQARPGRRIAVPLQRGSLPTRTCRARSQARARTPTPPRRNHQA